MPTHNNQGMKEKILESIEQLEGGIIKCPCGKYCVQEGRNEAYREAIGLLKDLLTPSQPKE